MKYDRALQLQAEGIEYNTSLYYVELRSPSSYLPIFMSAGTSVLGMLPLAILPGKGAELYQGLGIVLTGGLIFSTFLTPTVIPALWDLWDYCRIFNREGVNKSVNKKKQWN